MIYAVTNRKLVTGDFLTRIEQLSAGQPDGIILREKDLTEDDYATLAEACLKICERYQVSLIVNTYKEVAAKLGIPTLQLSFPILISHNGQLGQNKQYTHIFRSFEKIGVSIHSVEEAQAAATHGADFLIAGHIFATDCKKGLAPRGLDFLQAVCASVTLPVFAIGGVSEKNIQQVMKTGATGVCVMSQLMICDDPAEKIAEYRKLMSS